MCLTVMLGAFAACVVLLDATASLARMYAATAMPVALCGLYVPGPMGFVGICCEKIPRCAAMLSAAVLAAIVIFVMLCRYAGSLEAGENEGSVAALLEIVHTAGMTLIPRVQHLLRLTRLLCLPLLYFLLVVIARVAVAALLFAALSVSLRAAMLWKIFAVRMCVSAMLRSFLSRFWPIS